MVPGWATGASTGNQPLPRAEGVGFEPTVPCDTTVFETVRFVRSRIPPPERLAAAPGREEPGQQCGRLCRPDPDGDRYLVVEPGIGAQVVEGAACPRLHVGGPVDQAAQPSGDEGTGAHRSEEH